MKKYLIIAFLMAQGFAGPDPSASTDIGVHIAEGFLDMFGDNE